MPDRVRQPELLSPLLLKRGLALAVVLDAQRLAEYMEPGLRLQAAHRPVQQPALELSQRAERMDLQPALAPLLEGALREALRLAALQLLARKRCC